MMDQVGDNEWRCEKGHKFYLKDESPSSCPRCEEMPDRTTAVLELQLYADGNLVAVGADPSVWAWALGRIVEIEARYQ